jgi:predicted ATPase
LARENGKLAATEDISIEEEGVMPIQRVEIKNFLVFRDEFSVDFCPGVNVIIGGNGSGKTTLIKAMYRLCNGLKAYTGEYFFHVGSSQAVLNNRDFHFERIMLSIADAVGNESFAVTSCDFDGESKDKAFDNGIYRKGDVHMRFYPFASPLSAHLQPEIYMGSREFPNNKSVFIPAAEMLSHSQGLLELFAKYNTIPFDQTQIDILVNAGLPTVREELLFCDKLLKEIGDVIEGEVLYENGDYYVCKHSGMKLKFSVEANGFRKFALLWKLLRNGLLEPGSILFWDEPEASINPELIPKLVDILLELQRSGVQIFLATHDEILAAYFNANRQSEDNVMFYSLYKDGDRIKTDKNERFDLLIPNNLKVAPVKLYEKEIERWLHNE